MFARIPLAPTFRNSCSVAAPTFTNFGKSWALENLLILVPLCRSEVPDRTRRLWRRDFRSAVLAILALAATASGAFAAPAQLYGKSIVVNWTENRMQTTDVSETPTPRTVSGQLSVYVSDQGRAFSRVTMSVSTRRGTRSGSRDAVQGEATRRSASFHGNAMTVAWPRGDTGAVMIAVTFDSSFSGCSAHVAVGKANGAQSTRFTSLATGRQRTLFSAQASGESCSVQSGNVFGN
jgi:hypothetical protein